MKLKYLPLVLMSRVGTICLEHEVEEGEYYIVTSNQTTGETFPIIDVKWKHHWKLRKDNLCHIYRTDSTFDPEYDAEKIDRYFNPVSKYEVLIIEGPTS